MTNTELETELKATKLAFENFIRQQFLGITNSEIASILDKRIGEAKRIIAPITTVEFSIGRPWDKADSAPLSAADAEWCQLCHVIRHLQTEHTFCPNASGLHQHHWSTTKPTGAPMDEIIYLQHSRTYHIIYNGRTLLRYWTAWEAAKEQLDYLQRRDGKLATNSTKNPTAELIAEATRVITYMDEMIKRLNAADIPQPFSDKSLAIAEF